METFGNNLCVTLLTIVLTLTSFDRVKSMVFDSETQEDSRWKNCSLNVTSIKEYRLFNNSIVKHRLVKLTINLSWLDIPINGTRNNSDIVKQRWFIATEEAGKQLLLLDNQFEIMSLGTLSIKVGRASLTLTQTPQDCIAEISESQARETISAYVLELVIKRRTNDEDKENEDEINSMYVCNGTLNENGVCCFLNDENIMSCVKLEENKWTRQFHIIVYILTVFVISQSIRLIPQSFYKGCEVRKASVKTPIKLDITDTNFTNLKLKFLKNANNDNDEQSEPEITKSSQDAEFTRNPVWFYIEESRFESQTLKTSGFLNVFRDLLQFINDIFCKCIYKDREEVRECCFYNIGEEVNKCICKKCCCYNICKTCYCFNCLSWLMNVLLLSIISLPFILRMIFLHYADVEHFKGELLLFIFGLADIIFLFLYIHILKYGLSTHIRDKVRVHLNKSHVRLKECLDLVMAASLQAELMYGLTLISCCFVYCARLSGCRCWIVLGLLLFIFLVIVLTIFIHLKCLMVTLPLVHVIFRFPLFVFKQESRFFKQCLIYVLYWVLIPCLFVFTEPFIQTIVFYITCCLYVTIGCVLNFDDLSVYITAFVLISTYMYKCIQNVSITTRSFKKKIIDTILECDKKNSYSSEIDGTIKDIGNTSYLQTNHFLFYYKSDNFDNQRYMYVSKAFLEHVSSIPSTLTPGPRYWLYCKALAEIGAMFMLLCLLVIIVVSYGNAIDLSTGVKTLITLGSGALIIFLFNKFFEKAVSHSVYENKELFDEFIKDQLETGIDEIWIQLPAKRNEQIEFELHFDDTARLDAHDSNINVRVSGIYYESFENSENTAAKVPF